jgi:hypothetical protein
VGDTVAVLLEERIDIPRRHPQFLINR